VLFQGEEFLVAGHEELGLAGFSQREQITVLGVRRDGAGGQVPAKKRESGFVSKGSLLSGSVLRFRPLGTMRLPRGSRYFASIPIGTNQRSMNCNIFSQD
jgi:hypothetical protein